MNVDELVKEELLKRVKVNRPSNEVIDAGNRMYMTVIGETVPPLSPRRMSGMDCECNSTCVVEAMCEIRLEFPLVTLIPFARS